VFDHDAPGWTEWTDVTDPRSLKPRVKALADSDPDAARGVACQRYAIP
jgi:hypothetical protein